MRRMHYKKEILFLLALLLLLTFVPSAMAESEAKDLTRSLQVEKGGGHPNTKEILDTQLNETIAFAPYETLRLSWPNASQHPAYLCMQWGEQPEHVRLRQTDKDGKILTDGYAESVYDAIIPLEDNAAGVTIIAGPAGMDIARLALYGKGTLPAPFFPWQDTPKGMDYLLIATHPDDDVLFMGGVIPTYGAEKGYVGTVAYAVSPTRKRVNEAHLGAWEMGTVYRPLFLGFQDINPRVKDYYPNRFDREAVTLAVVRLLREYKPLVVFTQDTKGEYGHWQHIILSASVIEASRLCADPTYDAISCEQFGTWEVKKCYVHKYEENPFVMDIRTPLSSRGGRTALQVAQDAFKLHGSQQSGRHVVQSETDRDAMNRFGMAYGTVDVGNDVFDNIDPSLLYASISKKTPEPTEAPTPEPTAEPTEAPTAEPTEPPTAAPTDASTPVPVAAETDEPTQTTIQTVHPQRTDWGAAITAALIGAAIASACFLIVLMRRRRG